MTALETAKQYYNCFNAKDFQGMLSLLDPNIRHEPNQGEPRIGIEKFAEFLQLMEDSYDETLTGLTFFTEPNDKKVAVEFIVSGKYLKADDGMPAAHGQSYVLPAAAFLEIKNGKITRVTTYYNLALWIKLVS
ncbi:MAG: nuclear transport factor 2 family protein [Saprospiraceae bacterium]|nr:nuclear transport factor 2 family protein [Saprospiraceae bacterium]